VLRRIRKQFKNRKLSLLFVQELTVIQFCSFVEEAVAAGINVEFFRAARTDDSHYVASVTCRIVLA